jgi:hypothetical protein
MIEGLTEDSIHRYICLIELDLNQGPVLACAS